MLNERVNCLSHEMMYSLPRMEVAPSVLASWQRIMEDPMPNLEGHGKVRWCDFQVVPRKVKHEEEKHISVPRAISLPDLALGKGAWPMDCEATSSKHGKHLKGFAYEKLENSDKYTHFSVKIRDPARFNFLETMDLSLSSDNPRPSKKVRG